jgi:hypothetical protein
MKVNMWFVLEIFDVTADRSLKIISIVKRWGSEKSYFMHICLFVIKNACALHVWKSWTFIFVLFSLWYHAPNVPAMRCHTLNVCVGPEKGCYHVDAVFLPWDWIQQRLLSWRSFCHESCASALEVDCARKFAAFSDHLDPCLRLLHECSRSQLVLVGFLGLLVLHYRPVFTYSLYKAKSKS